MPRRTSRSRAATLGLVTALAIAGCAVALLLWRSPGAPSAVSSAPCPTLVRVVTAASFEPVLKAVAPTVADGEDCAQLDVNVADGRAATKRLAEVNADVWIPDDSAWAALINESDLIKPAVGGAGTVVATSPIYLVTDPATAERVSAAGSSWLGLTNLVTGGSGVRMVLNDPAGSGNGLVAAGAVGEAVWVASGMNASSEALAQVVPATRTVPGTELALPAETGEVGLVPEYAMLNQPAATATGRVVLAPVDHTAMLRYTWLPTALAAANPDVARAMDRLLHALLGPQVSEHLAAAGLRGPERDPPDAVASGLPSVSSPPFEVLGRHHVEHVFATWYAEDRRSDLLLAVDVSGSMARPAPGADVPLMDLVRDGCNEVGELLPDDSTLALWEFGSGLDPPRDHRVVLPRGLMTAEHRQALAKSTAELRALHTGTGLNDTLLAAYLAARDAYRPGTPSHVVLFTDGRNEADPGSLSMEQLVRELEAAKDPQRPVLLTVLSFGPEAETRTLANTLKPLGVYVDPLATADEVRAAFIHVAAGGLHR